MITANQRATRLDDCQYLLSSQINYTLTNKASHSQHYSHHHYLNRYLRGDKLTPRQVNEGDEHRISYRRVDSLAWRDAEQRQGKRVHVKDFPAGHRLQLFRLVLSTERTDYVVTNDRTQTSTDDTQQVCAIRWKIEQLHREAKQLTGMESCQCRTARIQRGSQSRARCWSGYGSKN